MTRISAPPPTAPPSAPRGSTSTPAGEPDQSVTAGQEREAALYRRDMFEFVDQREMAPFQRQAQSVQATCRAIVSQRLAETQQHPREVMDIARSCDSEMSCMSKSICKDLESRDLGTLRAVFTAGDADPETKQRRLQWGEAVQREQPWLDHFSLDAIENREAREEICEFMDRHPPIDQQSSRPEACED